MYQPILAVCACVSCLVGCGYTLRPQPVCPLEAVATPPLGSIPNDNDVKLFTPGSPSSEQLRQIEELQHSLHQTSMHLRSASDEHEMLLTEVEIYRSDLANLESQNKNNVQEMQRQTTQLEEGQRKLLEQDEQLADVTRRLQAEQQQGIALRSQLQLVNDARQAEQAETLQMLDELITKHQLAVPGVESTTTNSN